MNSNTNPLSGLGSVIDLITKTLGPTIVEAFNGRSEKPQTPESAEISGIVSTMLRALAGKPTAGHWHTRRTPNAQGTVINQVFAGEVEVAGSAMTEADANYLAAVSPEAVGKLLVWHAVREEAKAEAAKFEVSGATLDKLHSGDRLSDEEVVGLVRHFRKLDAMLSPMGPTWHLASEEARRELNRVESLLRARNLSA